MGYFDGLTDALFKKDEVGRTVFYPWGVLGKGHILTDEEQQNQLRGFVKSYYKVMLPSIIVLSLVGRMQSLTTMLILLGIATLVFMVWFIIGTKRRLHGAAASNSSLKLSEAYQNSAKSHSSGFLYFGLVSSLLFVTLGIFLLNYAQNSQQRTSGIACIAFFGLGTTFYAYMIRAKNKHKRRSPPP